MAIMHRLGVIACLIGSGTQAVAQPLDPAEAPSTPEPSPAPEPPTDEVIDLDAPDREHPSAAPAPAPGQPPEPGDDDGRPDHLSVGIGVGYTLPADFTIVNAASVRLRFAGGLVLEPIVDLHTTQDSDEFLGVESEDGFTEVSALVLGRLPLAQRGPVDFVGVAGAGFAFTDDDPGGADNSTTVTALALVWGLGLDYWISERWVLSATATNPLFDLTLSSTERTGGDDDRSTYRIGATFDPSFAVMGHLFF